MLLIDDEPVVRMTLAANLELAGFDVVAADGVIDALKALVAQRFDCVVSDVRMPEIDGVTGLERLHAIQPDLPAILVTGYDPESVIPAALSKGAFTVLAKPVRIATLVQVVRACMRDPIVLVVDDEEPFLESLVEGLRTGGMKVERASNQEDARGMLAARSVDVCVLDLVLGDETGADVLAALRSQQPGLSVIAMTGHEVDDLVRDALKNGALHCLKKPFDMGVLTRLIARARADRPTNDLASTP